MQFDWHYLFSLFTFADFWHASWLVVQLSLLTWVGGVVLGLGLAFARQSPRRWVSQAAAVYIWLFRSLPLLVLLIFIFNLPQMIPETGALLSSPFIAGAIALILSETAYIAEIHRGGLISVQRGQYEAGKALGLGNGQIRLKIIIPQALRISLPTLVNEFITIVKMTSLVSVISLSEILMVGERLYTENFKVMETLLAVACYYVLIVTLFERLFSWLEKRLDIQRRQPAMIDADQVRATLPALVPGTRRSVSPSAKPILELSNIQKAFNGKTVLNGINLAVRPGEIISIIGPSGSGKTTLIRTINGLETLDGGTVRLLGHDFIEAGQADNALSWRSNITKLGMVFQGFNLFPHKTVLENLMLAPRLHFEEQPEGLKQRCLAMLDKVGMLEHANKYPHQLSGGQQQRVAIARTLVMRPSVVLFDEPTSALDPERVTEVLDVIAKLAQEGITMLIVTHEMKFAFTISDRVVFMEHGNIEVDASPNAILQMREHRINRFIQDMATA
ncbi:amino acid ABC transporter permease/ATP-binding protein [Mangrovibacter yixingensis]|uniref:amino acid ABC transporter permease/ATP-binding protein n=1 Tax=Mangrovibacter yixingensis TaxID=1529639 RepID=UPI001CFB14F5|nr:amino acid ABC transporter permease/ATP-binding protein [Mangrovibacter yixingensis]